jgi:hypothetical protein
MTFKKYDDNGNIKSTVFLFANIDKNVISYNTLYNLTGAKNIAQLEQYIKGFIQSDGEKNAQHIDDVIIRTSMTGYLTIKRIEDMYLLCDKKFIRHNHIDNIIILDKIDVDGIYYVFESPVKVYCMENLIIVNPNDEYRLALDRYFKIEHVVIMVKKTATKHTTLLLTELNTSFTSRVFINKLAVIA